jgi:hypothetical protein
MPITVNCPCGKSFTVGDEFAGRTGKCKGCGAALVVPAPAADTGDVELLDDEPEPVVVVEEKPAPKKAAVVVEEPEKPSGVVGAPKAAKKRKKKKKKAGTELSAADEVAQVIAYEARVKRIITASTYIALGLVILGGAWFMWNRQKDAVDELGGQGRFMLIALLVGGVAAVGKGLFGLFFGHFFELGDED